MITTIQGLIILLFFVIPGFIVVESSNIIAPTRKCSTFDKTIASVIWSTLIHLPVISIIAVIICIHKTRYDEVFVALNNHAVITAICLIAYFVFISCIAAPILGYIFTRYKKRILRVFLKEKLNILQATSVWDYIKNEVRPYVGNLSYAIRAKITMSSGVKYYGDITVMPAIIDDDKPYNIYIQKVKRVDEKGHKESLDQINGVMLNSAKIESVEIKFIKPEDS